MVRAALIIALLASTPAIAAPSGPHELVVRWGSQQAVYRRAYKTRAACIMAKLDIMSQAAEDERFAAQADRARNIYTNRPQPQAVCVRM